jgi:hypothetical protein
VFRRFNAEDLPHFRNAHHFAPYPGETYGHGSNCRRRVPEQGWKCQETRSATYLTSLKATASILMWLSELQQRLGFRSTSLTCWFGISKPRDCLSLYLSEAVSMASMRQLQLQPGQGIHQQVSNPSTSHHSSHSHLVQAINLAASHRTGSTSFAAIGATLVPTLITGIAFVVAFLLLRRPFRNIYMPRTYFRSIPEQ